jgi:hypothetical protein
MKIDNTVLILAVAIVLVVLIIAYTIYSKPPTNPPAPPTKPPAGLIPLDVQAELNNTKGYGFDITYDMLAANLPSQCALIQAYYCNNNDPKQFVCVNEAYASNLKAQYGGLYHTIYPQMRPGYVCPMFLLGGNLSCVLSSGYCVVKIS